MLTKLEVGECQGFAASSIYTTEIGNGALPLLVLLMLRSVSELPAEVGEDEA